MRNRSLITMALSFLALNKVAQQTIKETNNYKDALAGSQFENVNVGESPIFFPTKTMQINRKRRLKRL